jgi:hypothetical protein
MYGPVFQPKSNHTQPLPADTDVSPVGPAGDPTLGLSGDALLAYIETKLNDTDGQIKDLLNHQKTVQAEQARIQQLMTEINSLQSKIKNQDSNGNGTLEDPAAEAKLEQDIEACINYIQSIDPGSPALGQLRALHDRVMATSTGPLDADGNPAQKSGKPAVDGYYYNNTAPAGQPPNGQSPPPDVRNDTDGKIGTDEFKDFTDTLQGINSDLSSGSQIEMIKLQSMVSDRSTSIQLATNIMQSVHDAEQKTVANIHA